MYLDVQFCNTYYVPLSEANNGIELHNAVPMHIKESEIYVILRWSEIISVAVIPYSVGTTCRVKCG